MHCDHPWFEETSTSSCLRERASPRNRWPRCPAPLPFRAIWKFRRQNCIILREGFHCCHTWLSIFVSKNALGQDFSFIISLKILRIFCMMCYLSFWWQPSSFFRSFWIDWARHHVLSANPTSFQVLPLMQFNAGIGPVLDTSHQQLAMLWCGDSSLITCICSWKAFDALLQQWLATWVRLAGWGWSSTCLTQIICQMQSCIVQRDWSVMSRRCCHCAPWMQHWTSWCIRLKG